MHRDIPDVLPSTLSRNTPLPSHRSSGSFSQGRHFRTQSSTGGFLPFGAIAGPADREALSVFKAQAVLIAKLRGTQCQVIGTLKWLIVKCF